MDGNAFLMMKYIHGWITYGKWGLSKVLNLFLSFCHQNPPITTCCFCKLWCYLSLLTGHIFRNTPFKHLSFFEPSCNIPRHILFSYIKADIHIRSTYIYFTTLHLKKNHTMVFLNDSTLLFLQSVCALGMQKFFYCAGRFPFFITAHNAFIIFNEMHVLVTKKQLIAPV